MLGRLRRSGLLAQQLGAALLIFALLLQGMAVAFATGRLAAAASGDLSWAGFELCRHDGGAAQLGGDPDGPATTQHCIFCLAGVAAAVGPPAPAAKSVAIVFVIVPWQFVPWRLPADPVRVSAQPRGPPQRA